MIAVCESLSLPSHFICSLIFSITFFSKRCIKLEFLSRVQGKVIIQTSEYWSVNDSDVVMLVLTVYSRREDRKVQFYESLFGEAEAGRIKFTKNMDTSSVKGL